MDPTMHQQQQQQYYYAPAGGAPCGYYPPQMGGAGAAPAPDGGYVLPMQPQPQQQMMYYAAPNGQPMPAPGYAYAPAPMYYQPPEAAFAAMSLSGQTVLQPQQTPGASSTTSNGSATTQPRASSTPIPSADEPASLAAPAACNPSMIPMHVMYTQMPQYYAPMGYDSTGQPQMMPVVYQDPTTGQLIHAAPQPGMQSQPQPLMQHAQQQHMQHQQHGHRYGMMSTDPDAIPENLDDVSQISHQSSPDSFIEGPQQRLPTTPVSSSIRRRVSLPGNQNMPALLPSNYKTRMCTQWLEKRECSMGNGCKFAHGNSELRVPDRPFRAINNPKYKTKMCKNFEPGASGLCAYAERCEYIHPTDREYIAYKQRAEALARARGDFTRMKNMFDEVPGARGGRGGSSTNGCDEENKSSVSAADSSTDYDAGATVAASSSRHRRGSERGYLGTAMPPSLTRSAIRMGAGADPAPMRRGFGGGSMYNLASGVYTDRDEYRTRLHRVPSASNVASLGVPRGRYSHAAGPPPSYSKFSRRASMCHLNAPEY